MADDTDTRLVTRIRQGDRDAFESLYERHKRAVYRTALAITSEPNLAEEVLQDTFLRTHQHIHELNGDPSLAPWLYRVAVNLCYSRLRLRRRQRIAVSLEDLPVLPLHLCSRSAEEQHNVAEGKNQLMAEIERLPFKHRAVIVLHYLQGFSLDEIAYVMDCPVGTCKSRLHHARQALAQALGPASVVAASAAA
jgi:RNA polymerase sigma-70 factor, ECF subfamily